VKLKQIYKVDKYHMTFCFSDMLIF